ncbi:MAG: hypothetical protein V4558_05675 [Gemmatimonadota bacterium]
MHDLPSAEQYRKAPYELKHAIAPKHKKLLLRHYEFPAHTATATDLAAAVGYPNYNTINLQDGQFGLRLAERMNWEIQAGAQAAFVIASFVEPDEDNPHWRWLMHPELAEALQALDWVKKPGASM